MTRYGRCRNKIEQWSDWMRNLRRIKRLVDLVTFGRRMMGAVIYWTGLVADMMRGGGDPGVGQSGDKGV